MIFKERDLRRAYSERKPEKRPIAQCVSFTVYQTSFLIEGIKTVACGQYKITKENRYHRNRFVTYERRIRENIFSGNKGMLAFAGKVGALGGAMFYFLSSGKQG